MSGVVGKTCRVDLLQLTDYNGLSMKQERISLQVDDIKLVGRLYWPQTRADKTYPALCLCHGIPARAPDPSDQGYAALAERFSAEGFMVLIFNFRGAGESEGNFDILGWSRDLEAMLGLLYEQEQVDSSRLSVMGFSGGAAVSVYVAARDQRICSLVTCASPARFSQFVTSEGLDGLIAQLRSIGTIKDSNFPPSFEEWAQGFETITPLNWVQCISPRPLLIIHGDGDDLIHLSQAQMLYDKAGEPKELFMVPGGGHRLRIDETAMTKALDWLKRVNKISQ